MEIRKNGEEIATKGKQEVPVPHIKRKYKLLAIRSKHSPRSWATFCTVVVRSRHCSVCIIAHRTFVPRADARSNADGGFSHAVLVVPAHIGPAIGLGAASALEIRVALGAASVSNFCPGTIDVALFLAVAFKYTGLLLGRGSAEAVGRIA